MIKLSYAAVMGTLLTKFVGTEDTSLIDYKNIDSNETIEQMDTRKVKGSVRLMFGRIKTDADVKNLSDKVMGVSLP
jgi:hypothetical protein